jgi:hypothetical protein
MTTATLDSSRLVPEEVVEPVSEHKLLVLLGAKARIPSGGQGLRLKRMHPAPNESEVRIDSVVLSIRIEAPQQSRAHMTFPKQCSSQCSLTTALSLPHSALILSEAHVACVWREHATLVRRLVVRELYRRNLCIELTPSGIAVVGCGCKLACEDLAEPDEVDDLVQDVACALVQAIQQGKVRAARPALAYWLEQTVCQLVHTEIAACTSTAISVHPDNDNAEVP